MLNAIEVRGRVFDAVKTETYDCAGCAACGNEAMCEAMPECVQHPQAPLIWVERKAA